MESEFDLLKLSSEHRSFLSQLLSFASSAVEEVANNYGDESNSYDLETRYIADRQFNAFAWLEGSTQRVAVNISAPTILHFLFNCVMRHEGLFPEVGDTTDEEPYAAAFKNGIPLELPDGTSISDAVRNLPSVSRPSSDERTMIATGFTELACVFLIFHEVGHIVAGHTEYSRLRFGESRMAEFRAAGIEFCPRRLLRQVWEYEADSYATVMLMSYVLSVKANRSHLAETFGIDDDSDYDCHALSFALFAVSLLFLYLGQLRRRLRSRSYHPHALVRSSYVHNSLRDSAINGLGIDADPLDEALDSMSGCADYFGQLVGFAPSYSFDKPRDAIRLEREMDRLDEAFERLRQRYSKHAWFPPGVWTPRSS